MTFHFLFNYHLLFVTCLDTEKKFYTDGCTTFLDNRTFTVTLRFYIGHYLLLNF